MQLKRSLIIALAIFTVSCGTDSEVVSTSKDALSVIHSRKSVRSFTDQSVNRDILIEIVKAGMYKGYNEMYI